jgi:hypothetical protein
VIGKDAASGALLGRGWADMEPAHPWSAWRGLVVDGKSEYPDAAALYPIGLSNDELRMTNYELG